MLERRIEQPRRDPLPPLIRGDDEADDRAQVARALARDALELRFGRRVAPPDDAPEAISDEAVRFGRADELTARRAVLCLRPVFVVIDEPFHAEAFRPVRVV